jgi:hypothetical protein
MAEIHISLDTESNKVTIEPDLPREQGQRLADAVAGMWERLEWERNTPVHVCRRKHGSMVHEPDFEDESKTIPVLGRDGKQTVTHRAAETPTCHDCGRGLVRPHGTEAESWVCPQVHGHPASQRLPTGAALECGDTR